MLRTLSISFETRSILSICYFLILMSTTGLGAETSSTGVAATTFAEKAPSALLDVVVVTATRTDKKSSLVPASVNVLDATDLSERLAVRSIPESLRDLPGIMVQKTSHGQGSPYIRGFTGFRNLFLIDGIRLNNSVFRDGPNQYWNTVDPMSISRMEIVKGPGSVLYGSDAIGGTVNALTREREPLPGGSSWERRIFIRYASAENSRTLRSEVSGGFGPLELLVGNTIKVFGDVVAGEDVGKQPKTGYKEWDGDVKLNYHLTEDSQLIFAHQEVHQDDAWRTHKTIYAISWEDTDIGNEKKRSLDQDRQLTYLQYHASNTGMFFDSIKANISFHNQKEEQFRRRSDDRIDRQGIDVGTLGMWVQLSSPSPVGCWTSGVEYYRDNVNSFKKKWNADGSFDENEIQGPVADDALYRTLGVYLQNEFSLEPGLDITLGIRYNHAAADVDKFENPISNTQDSFSKSWDSVLGSARFLYRLDQNEIWMLYGGVSQGFRAPNLSDLTRLDTARSNELETPSPDLDPEKYISYELGIRIEHEKLSAQATCFYTDIDKMIVRTPTGNIIDGDNEVTKKNAGDGYVQGIEFNARYRFLPHWSLFATVSWLDGEVDTYPTSSPEAESEPLDRLMPTTGLFGVRWDSTGKRYWVEGVLNAAEKADNLSTRDESDTQRIPPGGTPSYVTVTLRSGWKLSDTLTISAAIENLTNEDYRIHGSGQNEPGTNVVLGLDWKF